ncbi:ribulose-5-phosphate-3-epimerase [Holotrichia oblita]|nr:ribulose-5-phosphate-3-epimerase [Holotrichia oblita]
MGKIKLAPSILSADISNLYNDVRRAEDAGAEYLHIDVMDGHFVKNITFGTNVVSALRDKSKMVFDVHLMIDNPNEDNINAFRRAGADIITVHAEVVHDLEGISKIIRNTGARAGISINPDTPLDTIIGQAKSFDMVLLMTVVPGLGGQAYIHSVTRKIEELKRYIDEQGLDIDIEVDGGINAQNINIPVMAGANVIVAGSAVFGCADISATVMELREAKNGKRGEAMKAYIFLAGEVEDYSFLRSYFECDDYKNGKILTVCADGGIKHAEKLGIKVDIVIGDMDSVGSQDFNGVKTLVYPKDKDKTDGWLAVDYALDNGCDDITIFGALGGRFDHSWGNVFLLKYIAKRNGVGRIADSKRQIFFVDKFLKLDKNMLGHGEKPKYVSVFSAGDMAEGVTLKGFKYPLDNAVLLLDDGIGISNEFADDTASVSVERGELLVIVEM